MADTVRPLIVWTCRALLHARCGTRLTFEPPSRPTTPIVLRCAQCDCVVGDDDIISSAD